MDVLVEDSGFCVATHGRLLVIVWGRAACREDLDQITAMQRPLVAEHGHCVSLTVIRVRISLRVSDEVREASAQNMREFGKVNHGAAVIVEAGGLRASMVRSLITGVQMLAFSPMTQKMFSSIDDGVRWVVARPGLVPSMSAEADELVAAIHSLADRYGGPCLV